MKTILQDLYYGNLNPSGKAFLPDSPYGRLVNDLTETEEKLLPLLTSAEKQLYAARTGSDAKKFYALVEFPYPSGAGRSPPGGALDPGNFFRGGRLPACPCINRLFLL